MKRYLIYRPVLDYEDTIVPLLVCDTKQHATTVRDRIIVWCHGKLGSLPKHNEEAYDRMNEVAAEDAKYEKSLVRNEAIRSIKRWPYGISELSYIFTDFQNGFVHEPETFIQIMPLPLIDPTTPS